TGVRAADEPERRGRQETGTGPRRVGGGAPRVRPDMKSDLVALTVQAVNRFRAIVQELEARGHARSVIDREMRLNMASVAPAIKSALRLEMTRDEIARWL